MGDTGAERRVQPFAAKAAFLQISLSIYVAWWIYTLADATGGIGLGWQDPFRSTCFTSPRGKSCSAPQLGANRMLAVLIATSRP